MEHIVVAAPPGRALARTYAEAVALLRALVVDPRVDVGLLADHAHVLGPPGTRAKLLRAVRGWGVRRSRAGVQGPHARVLPAVAVRSAQHLRRTRRYVHLQAVRAARVADALAWPHGTLLDRLGLTLDPLVPRHPAPQALWAYVRAHDRWPSGPLPAPAAPPFRAHRLTEAFLVARRATRSQLTRRGPLRTAWLAALRDLGDLDLAPLAAASSVHTTTLRRAPPLPAEAAHLLARLAADPRIRALDPSPARPIPPPRASRATVPGAP